MPVLIPAKNLSESWVYLVDWQLLLAGTSAAGKAKELMLQVMKKNNIETSILAFHGCPRGKYSTRWRWVILFNIWGSWSRNKSSGGQNGRDFVKGLLSVFRWEQEQPFPKDYLLVTSSPCKQVLGLQSSLCFRDLPQFIYSSMHSLFIRVSNLDIKYGTKGTNTHCY